MARKLHQIRTNPAHSTTTRDRPPLFVAQLPTKDTGRRRIRRILVANRGEIACRIISTCKKLGITSIAIYAEEDNTSRHILEADEAVKLGSINQADGNPFLNVPLLVDIAQSVNADAIHPGYGYLSENGDFAEAVREAGITFIGPSAKAMSTLGDKRNSKNYLHKHEPSVPLIPGFAGTSQNIEDLEAAADKIGYPVILKASAGGGGRGMRIVRERSKLKGELERAKSEAQRSFGSSDCILEKYIEAAKHIEVQIMGDSHGMVLSLWERECSVQRRHQKVIEETPSPFLSAEQRRRMCAAAVRIGQLVGYEGAGTVEFVVDAQDKDAAFYFLEVNARLQVEHPITEELTGLDIVALQIYAAAGGSFADLPLQQIQQQGHAIECRLCAEDPANDFMPEHGTIRLWKEVDLTAKSRDVRYETSVQTESKVSIYFDSMIAKVIVWAPTRAQAILKMARVLANTACAGVRTNQLFLQSCLLHEGFQDPAYTTSFISNNLEALLKSPHHETSDEMQTMFSVIPGLLLRGKYLSTSPAQSHPFQHVRRGFRNQRFDPVNLDTNIVVPVDSSSPPTPLLMIWEPVVGPGSHAHKVFVLSLRSSQVSNEESSTDSAAISEVTGRYNALSKRLRSKASMGGRSYDVQIQKQSRLTQVNSTSWLTTTVQVSIGSSNVDVHVASPPASVDSAGSCQHVICHFPSLGTWMEYECYSVLSYFESLRQAATAESTGTTSKEVKAPMPCKVLSVLKKLDEEVRAGDVVMVIESMKMETNIVIPMDGKFQTTVKNGDAVEDGKVLCWVE